MKVLQTLGVHGATGNAGIFQYKRTSDGVYIDMSIGHVQSGECFTISDADWSKMLIDMEQGQGVFTLKELKEAVSDSLGDVSVSEASAIAAILEHEGTFDHYGGTVGRGASVSINLRRDD